MHKPMSLLALIAFASVPAAAAPDGNGKSDALTDGLLIMRNTPEECAAGRADDRLRNAGPMNSNADPKQYGEWIADVERPAASKDLDAGMNQLEGQDKPGNQQHIGRGLDIARVDGEIVSPGSPAASGLPTGKRQHKPVTLTSPVDAAACP